MWQGRIINVVSINFVILLMLLSSCENDEADVSLSGLIITEARALDNFTGISVDIAFLDSLLIVQGDSQELSLSITGDKSLVELIRTDVSSSTLEISTLPKELAKQPLVVMTITLPTLRKVETLGATVVNIEGFSAIETISQKGIGPLFINNGFTSKLSLSVSGIGEVSASDFIIDTLNVKHEGIGDVVVNVKEYMQGSICAFGDIYFKGNPEISVEAKGVGKLIDAN